MAIGKLIARKSVEYSISERQANPLEGARGQLLGQKFNEQARSGGSFGGFLFSHRYARAVFFVAVGALSIGKPSTSRDWKYA